MKSISNFHKQNNGIHWLVQLRSLIKNVQAIIQSTSRGINLRVRNQKFSFGDVIFRMPMSHENQGVKEKNICESNLFES